ncbi:CaiB/BaiF CoA transferase family protein [Phreatobacter sp. AB_2022a]|uniref:CaiB/BaiF CoA transferase family protein n=1 Tax=Phreatobacter sp. AB_2022a TaxID=3003134 RepID=UPI002286FEA9|nr:CoA transferase [Phreatobacter sp. AB_2022a]MCZ0736326.1 CoA transferase [Phreatobacter sp. AB_2022a]
MIPSLPKGLLAGQRVLDLTRVMSGPFCTAMLADLGAEVIKVEMPGFGDEGRHFAPHVNGESTYFALLNRGKRSITINMKSPDGIALVRDLARQADILVENFRPGVMERLGLGHEVLQADNPKLIYASISGFGQEGPLADLPAFDLVIQAMSGLMSVTGEAGGRATAVGESVADITTGMFAAWGIAAALYDRERTGIGRRLEVAMLDSVFSMLLTNLSRRLFTDQPTRRVGNRHPETYPVDSFATKTGDIVLVGFSEAIVKRIFEAIGQPELSADPRFKTNRDRNVHEAELRAILAGWAAGLTQDEALERLRAADVPAAPVWTLDDVLASDHVGARGLLVPGTNAKLGDIQFAPQPVRFAGAPAPGPMRAPTLGEDTEQVLRDELGLDDTRIAGLKAAKII